MSKADRRVRPGGKSPKPARKYLSPFGPVNSKARILPGVMK
jgi:hypothetical protein